VRAAAACGINALFMETHEDPPNALSDANTVLDIQYLERVLSHAKAVHTTRLELLDKWGVDNIHAER
jgi:2-dehydro-3-deoxyphosphooctonate aldolase (KDO 8-P synthase)